MTGDETWVNFFNPESKRQSMELHHTTSLRKKKFKTVRSAGEVMATVFWDADGVIMVDFFGTRMHNKFCPICYNSQKTKGTSSPSSPNKSYDRCSPFA